MKRFINNFLLKKVMLAKERQSVISILEQHCKRVSVNLNNKSYNSEINKIGIFNDTHLSFLERSSDEIKNETCESLCRLLDYISKNSDNIIGLGDYDDLNYLSMIGVYLIKTTEKPFKLLKGNHDNYNNNYENLIKKLPHLKKFSSILIKNKDEVYPSNLEEVIFDNSKKNIFIFKHQINNYNDYIHKKYNFIDRENALYLEYNNLIKGYEFKEENIQNVYIITGHDHSTPRIIKIDQIEHEKKNIFNVILPPFTTREGNNANSVIINPNMYILDLENQEIERVYLSNNEVYEESLFKIPELKNNQNSNSIKRYNIEIKNSDKYGI